jgi:DNA-binding Xre family transcriptional regulator
MRGRQLQSIAMATVHLVVKAVAEKKGIKSPFALAKVTGLDYATCYKLWNKDQQRIDLKTVARLCEALGVRPGHLFEYVE